MDLSWSATATPSTTNGNVFLKWFDVEKYNALFSAFTSLDGFCSIQALLQKFRHAGTNLNSVAFTSPFKSSTAPSATKEPPWAR